MSPADRARAARAAAEAARDAGEDPRTVAALVAAAALWERVAGPGSPWSLKGTRRELRSLRIELAVATGPFQPPRPPKAPSPAAVKPDAAELTRRIVQSVEHLREETIEF